MTTRISLYIENGSHRHQVASISEECVATSIDIDEHTAPVLLLMYDFLAMRLGQPAREGAIIPTADASAAVPTAAA